MESSRVLLASALAGALFFALAPKTGTAQADPAHSTYHAAIRIVADKYPVVGQEPIVVLHDERSAQIIWELPPRPSPYRFHDDGIAIDYDQFLGCRPVAEGLKYSCVDRHPRTHKLYPYRITVYGPGKDSKPLTSDATVLND